MKYKILETKLAQKDLEYILDYMIVSLANPSAATAFADKVEACYSNLEQMPMMYEFCHDPQLRAMGYHKVVIKNYIMIYKINEDNKTVTILRIFYGRQDYEKQI